MYQQYLVSAYSDSGLHPALHTKFTRLFRKKFPMDYSAYVEYKRPHAYRWASTWGKLWIQKD